MIKTDSDEMQRIATDFRVKYALKARIPTGNTSDISPGNSGVYREDSKRSEGPLHIPNLRENWYGSPKETKVNVLISYKSYRTPKTKRIASYLEF